MNNKSRLENLEVKLSVSKEPYVFETQTCRDIAAKLKDAPADNEPFSLEKIWKQIREGVKDE